MSTFTLTVLMGKLGKTIGDEKGAYLNKCQDALNNAIEEVYPALHYNLDNTELITGNILPNSHFEDWEDYVVSVTDYPDHYKISGGVTALADTTYIRGGTNSAKATRATTDGYMYISQAEWPRLLDLMGTTISFKCWTLASTASQAYIEIYTKQADGTAQTETSAAHSGGGEFELLEIEDFALNDDLTDIQFRFKVITTDGSVYFDTSRVTGKEVYEYLLPADFQHGEVLQVKLQSSGYSDDACDDLHPRFDTPITNFSEITDGGYRYLKLPALTNERRIRLIGDCPLENLSSSAVTITLDDDRRVQLLLTYAAHLIYEMKMGVVASESVGRYQQLSAYWRGKYLSLLPRLAMSRAMPYLKIGYG